MNPISKRHTNTVTGSLTQNVEQPRISGISCVCFFPLQLHSSSFVPSFFVETAFLQLHFFLIRVPCASIPFFSMAATPPLPLKPSHTWLFSCWGSCELSFQFKHVSLYPGSRPFHLNEKEEFVQAHCFIKSMQFCPRFFFAGNYHIVVATWGYSRRDTDCLPTRLSAMKRPPTASSARSAWSPATLHRALPMTVRQSPAGGFVELSTLSCSSFSSLVMCFCGLFHCCFQNELLLSYKCIYMSMSNIHCAFFQ